MSLMMNDDLQKKERFLLQIEKMDKMVTNSLHYADNLIMMES